MYDGPSIGRLGAEGPILTRLGGRRPDPLASPAYSVSIRLSPTPIGLTLD